jgi:hypothetical protein
LHDYRLSDGLVQEQDQEQEQVTAKLAPASIAPRSKQHNQQSIGTRTGTVSIGGWVGGDSKE